MFVHIIGPNLPDQSKGSFHVHAEGCSDVQRSPEYKSREFARHRAYTYKVTSRENAAVLVYADMIYEGSMNPGEGVCDLHFFPCTNGL